MNLSFCRPPTMSEKCGCVAMLGIKENIITCYHWNTGIAIIRLFKEYLDARCLVKWMASWFEGKYVISSLCFKMKTDSL
jgi:hypothetical protein